MVFLSGKGDSGDYAAEAEASAFFLLGFKGFALGPDTGCLKVTSVAMAAMALAWRSLRASTISAGLPK
jgi:hypothetical protein